MKTDSIFYEIFQSSPEVLFELIEEMPPDKTGLYSFVSQEVKQTRFQIDGILLPYFRRPDLPIYFIEVMGYKQKEGESLYHAFFSEVNLYLNDYRPQNDWRGIILFTERRFDPGLPQHYSEYANSPRFQRIYLNEMPEDVEGRSLKATAIRLIGIKDNSKAAERARSLVEQARAEVTDDVERSRIVELVLTILVYKFPAQTREEIRQMLGLNELKQTRFYQEIAQEERAAGAEVERDRLLALAIPALLEAGLSVEQVASKLKTDIPTIERIIQSQQVQN